MAPMPPRAPKSEHLVEPEFWRNLSPWKDVTREQFLSWRWSTKNLIERTENLFDFLAAVLPGHIPRRAGQGMQSRDEFMADVRHGIKKAAMSVRVMKVPPPYILSRINWKDPANDPIFRQFIPLRSALLEDHPQLTLDSLGERNDSPVKAIVHRYPDKVLFLPLGVCPTYCTFCTRSYGVGPATEQVAKHHFKPKLSQWEEAFEYIAKQKGVHDVVISGGDAYYLQPDWLEWIGERLIGMDNVQRFRFASKGLAVAPQRFLDEEDRWAKALIRVSDKARQAGKQMALHTHFNHANEISWVTAMASLRLLQANVTVRNQTVLLRGVNDDVDTMSALMQGLGQMGVQPYYVYQCDMVKSVEHLRTPLQTILDLEWQLRGTTAGFNTPNFVVDLPGGGGKRLACSYESYDRDTGLSTFTSPALKGKGREGKVYKYYDPVKGSL
ncbi:L-lysine-aminomutase [Xylariomycetidae sp. FL2044]|nr:L-lysine-aminomutase [Xylariomycetidae sp. FL2044]